MSSHLFLLILLAYDKQSPIYNQKKGTTMSSKSFLGEFELIQSYKPGGYAQVFKVRDKKFGHFRAVKVLHGYIESENDPQYINFLSECKKLLMLGNGGHPNILRIHRPLLRDNKAIVEMDFVEGDDLADYLSKNKFVPIDEVMKMLTDVSSALAFCHVDIYKYCINRDEDDLPDDPDDGQKVIIDDEARERLISKYRIVHNDMHSRNVIRRIDGTYILLDFGLAVNDNEANRSSRISNGAVQYKAPEKWKGEPVTTAVDIYGFGVMLYEFLAGQLPFAFSGDLGNYKDVHAHMEAHCKQTPSPIFPLRKQAFEAAHPGLTLNEPDYPEWIEELIMKCLAKNAADRFADGKELSEYVKTQLNLSSAQYKDLINHLDVVEEELKNVKAQKDKELNEAKEKARIIQQEYENKIHEYDAEMSFVKEQLEEEKQLAQKRIDELQSQLEQEKKVADKEKRILQEECDKEMQEAKEKVKQLEEQLARQQYEAEEKLKKMQEQYREQVSSELRKEHSDELIIDAVLSDTALNIDDVEAVKNDSPHDVEEVFEIPVLEIVQTTEFDKTDYDVPEDNQRQAIEHQPQKPLIVKPTDNSSGSQRNRIKPVKNNNTGIVIALMVIALILLYVTIIVMGKNFM